MDHFENIIAGLLENEGYWLRRSFKVEVTKEEKRTIGKHSIPRPEIDLLAYKASVNKVIVMEVKSYLDSGGVSYQHIAQNTTIPEGRYKLFTCSNYRQIVFGRLKNQLIENGMANKETLITLGLAAGKIYQNRESDIRQLFDRNQWLLWGPLDIKNKLCAQAMRGYENDASIITAKILLR